MLNIVIDFSKKDNIYMKFSKEIPANKISTAKVSYSEPNYIEKVKSAVKELRDTSGNSKLSLNFPAVYEGLLETKTDNPQEVLDILQQKSIDYRSNILIQAPSYNTEDYLITPVALIDIKYREIIDALNPEQFTTNMLRLLESGNINNKQGSLTIVYNIEESDTEVLFFNENNVPIAYTKTLGKRGITGIADIKVSNVSVRTPIEKRRVKLLTTPLDKSYYNMDIPTPTENTQEQYQPEPQYREQYQPEPQRQSEPQEYQPEPQQHMQHSQYQGQSPQHQQHQYQEQNQQPQQYQQQYREQPQNQGQYQNQYQAPYQQEDDYYEEEYQPKKSKSKKSKSKKSKPKKSKSKRLKSNDMDLEYDEDLGDDKKSPRFIFVSVLVVIAATVIVSILGKLSIDIIKGEKAPIEIDTSKDSVSITTYTGAAMKSAGVRANKVSSEIIDGKETMILEINNISDNDMLNLRSRLEIRCDIEEEELEANDETETEIGNRRMRLRVSYSED